MNERFHLNRIATALENIVERIDLVFTRQESIFPLDTATVESAIHALTTDRWEMPDHGDEETLVSTRLEMKGK